MSKPKPRPGCGIAVVGAVDAVSGVAQLEAAALKPDLKEASCMDVRYRWVFVCAANDSLPGVDSVCGGADGRDFWTWAMGGLNEVGGASELDDNFRAGIANAPVLSEFLST